MDRATLFVLILFGMALWGAYSIYYPFLLSMSVATLLSMATMNLTRELDYILSSRRIPGARKLVTLIMVMLLVLLILAPLFYIATTGAEYLSHFDIGKIKHILEKLRVLTQDIPHIGRWVQEYLKVERVTPYIKEISIYLTTMGSKGLGFLKNILFVITFYAGIVYYQDRFFSLISSLIPAPKEESGTMLSELASTMEVVLYSIIVTALFEGMLFGIFIGYFDFDGLLFGVIYGFASLVPIVGGAIVWAPLSLYAWSEIGSNSAIVIALYSIIVISIIADTFVKPFIIKIIKEEMLKNATRINELIIFFSILAGMSTYGFWGMILGPAITTFLFATSRIYIKYSNSI